ncbi:hypothetical protein O6H91_22G026100 [Diphasiastrum complanatum]|uniref:Uncharacterized protein n=1 Tax=Diphasiastrum complanatum TaxID=34168 RepID=A0ACC2AE70_DIPCM|nr:hypothetical protein O6H91_22G026100 [Diphasiastrum complanatum]
MGRAWRSAVAFLGKGLGCPSNPNRLKVITSSRVDATSMLQCCSSSAYSSFCATYDNLSAAAAAGAALRPWLLQSGGLFHSNDGRMTLGYLKSPYNVIRVQHFAKRPKKWQRGPYAFIDVAPDAPCPSSQPNEGSVKNRKRKKKMAQRQAFAKIQVHTQIANKKAVKAELKVARKKRWKEGAARARAWAQLTAKDNSTKDMVATL